VQCNGSLGSPTHGRIRLLSRCVPVSKCVAVLPIPLLLHFQELRADLERQQRVLHNAAIIQARDQEERARISAASAPAVTVDQNPSPSTPQEIRSRKQDPDLCSSDGLEAPPPSSELHDVKHTSGPTHRSELPPILKDRYWQPEAWTPQASTRRREEQR
jgi:NADH dehydrogenase [ubiquinone] 1 alpha subcomplex assembly factor 2